MREIRMNGLKELISGEEALAAIEFIGEVADKNEIDWAVCGGIAMAIYGSPRLTKDADVIASRILPQMEFDRPLGFGGRRYQIKIGKKDVPVDWIVRDDNIKEFYQTALTDAVMINEIPILTPEWLVITKYIAGRFKDQEDALFLLREKGLVNRKKIKAVIKKVGGDVVWGVFAAGLQRWFDLADGIVSEADDYNPKSRIE
jgi:hypothetical protein